MQGYTHFFPIAYAATDVTVYQQDVVIHRSEGTSYEETVGDLNVWHVYVGDRCKSDYGDIRFTDASGTALPYYLWPDYTSSEGRICVRLEDADVSGKLVLYYGNPELIGVSDGDATYFLHDHFNSLGRWSGDVSSFAVSDGELYPLASDKHIRALVPGGLANTRVECRIKTTTAVTDMMHGPFVYPDWGFVIFGRRHHVSYPTRWGDGSTYFSTVPPQWVSGEYATDSIIVKDASVECYWNAERVLGVTSRTIVPGTVPGMIGIYTYGANTDQKIDWILVRAHSATPPAATAFGPEQASGTLHHVQGVVFGSANMMVI